MQARQDAEQRRLAGTVRAEKSKHLAFARPQRHATKRFESRRSACRGRLTSRTGVDMGRGYAGEHRTDLRIRVTMVVYAAKPTLRMQITRGTSPFHQWRNSFHAHAGALQLVRKICRSSKPYASIQCPAGACHFQTRGPSVPTMTITGCPAAMLRPQFRPHRFTSTVRCHSCGRCARRVGGSCRTSRRRCRADARSSMAVMISCAGFGIGIAGE